jgi:Tol biopolymer transport system component
MEGLAAMQHNGISNEAIEAQLEKILTSRVFAAAERPSRFLRFIVQNVLAGGAHDMKEYVIGVEVLGRKPSFDPRVDPIVRAEAGRLRSRLMDYYTVDGKHDPIRISLPKGTYVPAFELNVTPESVMDAGTTTRRRMRYWVAWAVATLVLLPLVAFGLIHIFQRSANRAVLSPIRFQLYPPDRTQFDLFGNVGPVRVSPDGRRIAFVASGPDGNNILWVRSLESLSANPMPGTEGAYQPFWSPDSRALGFFAKGKLKKVDLSGGSPQVVCDVERGAGGSWNRDGVIVFATRDFTPIRRVAVSGGVPVAVTTLDRPRKANAHLWPEFLPDGTHFLYLSITDRGTDPAIYAASLESKEQTQVLTVPSNVGYAQPQAGEPGYLLFVRDRVLMAQTFDPKLLKVSGEPLIVAPKLACSQIGNFSVSQIGDFSVSEAGVLIYRDDALPLVQLTWVNRQGRQIATAGAPGQFMFPELSPDEQRVAVEQFDSQTGQPDIWLLDLARGTNSRFTFGPHENEFPIWSPDGQQIVFGSKRNRAADLYTKPASGAGEEAPCLKTPATKYPTDWSQDGRFVVYENHTEKGSDLWILPVAGDLTAFPFLDSPFAEVDGRFSPDGHWMAYTSTESGRDEIYVRSFPGEPAGAAHKGSSTGGKYQISNGGGSLGRWQRDGKELFYLSDDMKMMAVEVKANSSTFHAGPPRALFDLRSLGGFSGFACAYAVADHGRRFLITVGVGKGTSVPITVVLNWLPEPRATTRSGLFSQPQ